MASSTLTIRLEDDDKQLISDFAQIFGLTTSEFVRQAALERIETELDLKAFDEALREYKEDPTTYTLEEIKRHSFNV